MFAITGISGQVGAITARTLLDAGQPLRAVVRNPAKAKVWAEEGCEVVQADMSDAAALASAFAGMDGVFILLPPVFDPSPGFTESRATVAALRSALEQARPGRVVCLSTIGAQARQPNLLQQLQHMERELGSLPLPVTFLRAAWFIENALWDVQAARGGIMPSYLQPLDKPVPMVATADVGRVAAELLMEPWQGRRIVELEGPRRITPYELAAGFTRVLGRYVTPQLVPRAGWEALFRAQGMHNPEPRMQMLDGFNQGWIEFEAGEAGSRKGTVELDTVLRQLVARAAA